MIFCSHAYQHHKSDDEISELIKVLQQYAAMGVNMDNYFIFFRVIWLRPEDFTLIEATKFYVRYRRNSL